MNDNAPRYEQWLISFSTISLICHTVNICNELRTPTTEPNDHFNYVSFESQSCLLEKTTLKGRNGHEVRYFMFTHSYYKKAKTSLQIYRTL